MIIDLHIHSQCSDGAFTAKQLMEEAQRRNIGFLSITDHDSIGCQDVAADLAGKAGIRYVSGVELNVTFSHPKYRLGKQISLDFLGYEFNAKNEE
jgi:predicted metal-dependent phosphoesterase TrpH